MTPRIIPLLTLLLVSLTSPTPASARTQAMRALYITDYGAFWHDYQDQADVLRDALVRYANVDITLVGKHQADALGTLRTPGFAAAYDVVIYNICLADNTDYDMVENIIAETRDRGVPAVLLHCAMHSFRTTSSELSWWDRMQVTAAKNQWQLDHPGTPFPIWSSLSGVDTTSHDWARAMTLERAEASHPITTALPAEWSTTKDELYRNIAVVEGVTPLYTAYSPESRRDHLVAWSHEVGGTRVFATTLGHGMQTIDHGTFHHLVANGILWAAGHLTDDGYPAPGYEGTEPYDNYQGTTRCHPGDIIDAGSIEDVQAAVARAAAEDRALKVVSLAASNSNSQIICPDAGGILLNLWQMNQVVAIDADALRVTVQPGIRLHDLSIVLAEHGLAIENMPDYAGVSVAGGIATGAHHSSLRTAVSMSDMVTSMTLVDGTGAVRVLTGDALATATTHLGVLGVIVEVTLAVVPQFKLRYGHASGRDGQLERDIEALVRDHDYARVMWFAGNGRYVIDYFDRVADDVPGRSHHNMWSSTAGIFRIVGSLPYKVINNAPLRAQCDSALLRSLAWLAPLKAIDSPSSAPVGASHEMLSSYCQPGTCPWDVDGVVSRTMEVAFPLSRLPEWMADVRGIIGENRACFPVLGIYLRFSRGSNRAMSFNYTDADQDFAAFEIHIPKIAGETAHERSAAAYDEIVQMTLAKYDGRPHWGKNSTPFFAGIGAGQFPRWHDFVSLKNELDPHGLFENTFWRHMVGSEATAPYAGCVLARDCICETDLHCGTGYRCVPGGHFADARVCVAD